QARTGARQCPSRHHAHAPLHAGDGRHLWRALPDDRDAACDAAQARLGIHARARLQQVARQRTAAAGAAAPGHDGPAAPPDDASEMIAELGDKPGIAGCVVASPRYEKVQSNGMMRVLAAMEERGLVLAFHGVANWDEPALAAIPRWGAVQAIGVPHSNMVHMT